jgi:hypothetical protein
VAFIEEREREKKLTYTQKQSLEYVERSKSSRIIENEKKKKQKKNGGT